MINLNRLFREYADRNIKWAENMLGLLDYARRWPALRESQERFQYDYPCFSLSRRMATSVKRRIKIISEDCLPYSDDFPGVQVLRQCLEALQDASNHFLEADKFTWRLKCQKEPDWQMSESEGKLGFAYMLKAERLFREFRGKYFGAMIYTALRGAIDHVQFNLQEWTVAEVAIKSLGNMIKNVNFSSLPRYKDGDGNEFVEFQCRELFELLEDEIDFCVREETRQVEAAVSMEGYNGSLFRNISRTDVATKGWSVARKDAMLALFREYLEICGQYFWERYPGVD